MENEVEEGFFQRMGKDHENKQKELEKNLEKLGKYCIQRIQQFEELNKELSETTIHLLKFYFLPGVRISASVDLDSIKNAWSLILTEIANPRNIPEIKKQNIKDFFRNYSIYTEAPCQTIDAFYDDVYSILDSGKPILPSNLSEIMPFKIRKEKEREEAERQREAEIQARSDAKEQRLNREKWAREAEEKKQRALEELRDSGLLDAIREELRGEQR